MTAEALEHDQALVQIVEMARLVVATDGKSPDNALVLADYVLEMHEHLRGGGPIPEAWTPAIRREVKQMLNTSDYMRMVRDSAMFLVWMLHQTPEGVLTISERELVAGEDAQIERWKNPQTGEITIRLVDNPPALTLVKET